jgi:protein NrfD
MSTVVYLFLAHLGVGIAFTLLLVSKEAGVKFFRFNAGMAAALVAAALAFRPGADAAGGSVITPASLTALGVTLGALTVYWIIAGRVLAKLRPVLAAIASIAGAAAVVLHALALPSIGGTPLAVLSALTSAGLLGGACTAMVLGHWYLVIPSMEVRHLQRAVGFHIITLVLRIAVVAAVLALTFNQVLPAGSTVARYVASIDGIFFWQRVLFGLAGPALLSYLTWETAKIRSTQSATGILYVDFFTVVVGEVLASYILLSAGVAI